MSALVERLIAARDLLKSRRQDFFSQEVLDAMADAANAIQERDKTILMLRDQITNLRAPLAIEIFGSEA